MSEKIIQKFMILRLIKQFCNGLIPQIDHVISV